MVSAFFNKAFAWYLEQAKCLQARFWFLAILLAQKDPNLVKKTFCFRVNLHNLVKIWLTPKDGGRIHFCMGGSRGRGEEGEHRGKARYLREPGERG